MDDDPARPREAEGNAGAFLAPFGGVIPMPVTPPDATDAPEEPEDPDTAPPRRARRSTLDWLLHRHDPPPKDR